MVNPDGVLRLDRLGEGRIDTGVVSMPEQVERIIRLVASHARAEVHAARRSSRPNCPPHVEGRRRAVRRRAAPGGAGPCFSIRKPAERLYTLDDYVADGIMTAGPAADLLRASGHAAAQHPHRRRHQLGQDDARQCPARRDGPSDEPASS
jgi:Flp pilus assembly CpaF family ATPase